MSWWLCDFFLVWVFSCGIPHSLLLECIVCLCCTCHRNHACLHGDHHACYDGHYRDDSCCHQHGHNPTYKPTGNMYCILNMVHHWSTSEFTKFGIMCKNNPFEHETITPAAILCRNLKKSEYCHQLNPFTTKSDQSQISPAASPQIVHHTVWRTWLFIAYSDERWLHYQFSLPHPYTSL